MKKTFFMVMIFMIMFAGIIKTGFAYNYTYTPTNITISTIPKDLVVQINLTFSNLSETMWGRTWTDYQYFDISYMPSTLFPIEANTTYPLTYQFSIPQTYLSGNYQGNIYFQIANESKNTIPIQINILPVTNFSVEGESVINTTSGSDGEILFKITNYGNIDTNINLSSTTNKFITFENSFTLYRGHSSTIPIFYTIDKNVSGIFNETLFFNDVMKNLTFVVIDNITPEITIAKIPEEIEVLKPFEIVVLGSDNIGIDYVSATIECNNLTERLIKGTNYYANDFYINITTSECPVTIFANDTSGNNKTITERIRVNSSGIKINQSITIPKIKPSQEYRTELGFLGEEVGFSLKITNFDFRPLYNISKNITSTDDFIEITFINSNAQTPISYNTEYKFNASGQLYLKVKPKIEGFYLIYITIEFPTQYFEVGKVNVVINGEAGSYSVTQPYNGNLAGRPVRCEPNDQGTYENSFYECNFKYPIDIDLSKLTLPITENEFNMLKNNYENQISDLKTKLSIADRNFWIVVIVVIVGIVGAFLYSRLFKVYIGV